MITKVTITGADESVDPSQLAELSYKYPFVEWGILVSRAQQRQPRFPGVVWLMRLAEVRNKSTQMDLSMHICGEYSKEFLRGGTSFMDQLPVNIFDRIQVNANADTKSGYDSDRIALAIQKHPQFEFIFQHKHGNEQMVEKIGGRNLPNVAALFDQSGGRGVLPQEWPAPLPYMWCGYAGGLGPHNLEVEMELIHGVTGDVEVWIDMESGVRSTGPKGDYFDLDKVEQCLKIAMAHIEKFGIWFASAGDKIQKEYNTRVIVQDYEQLKKIADYNNKPVDRHREIYFPTEVYTHLPGSSRGTITFKEWDIITAFNKS